MIIKM
jgi:predicted outer membrane repeat protein